MTEQNPAAEDQAAINAAVDTALREHSMWRQSRCQWCHRYHERERGRCTAERLTEGLYPTAAGEDGP